MIKGFVRLQHLQQITTLHDKLIAVGRKNASNSVISFESMVFIRTKNFLFVFFCSVSSIMKAFIY